MSFIKKYLQRVQMLFLLATIIFIYWVVMTMCSTLFQCMSDINLASMARNIFMLLFTMSGILMIICLVKSMVTDPGKVPQDWGYFLTDPDQKKRRFCLVCHIFKPERCHHCSACNRCVLNMDHHCPWINNCVGFHNRKFFLQMLLYVIITTIQATFSLLIGLYTESAIIYGIFRGETEHVNYLLCLCMIIAFVLSCIILVLISAFFKFHIELVLTNRTTIENLDRRRQEDTGQQVQDSNPFDMGLKYNWLQVFGNNKLLWFIPITAQSGDPVGDGILWPKPSKLQSQKEDAQSPQFTSPKTNDNSQLPITQYDNSFHQQGLGSGNSSVMKSQLHQNPQPQQQPQQQFSFVGGQYLPYQGQVMIGTR